MKKIVLSLLAVVATATAATAQVEIGVKVSPSIVYLRPDAPSEKNFVSESAKVSFGGGLLVDYFFGENYAFSSGLFLTGKGGTISYNDVSANGGGILKPSQKIALQYLEIPATVKLFTNEITTDVRLYAQLGASLAVPIGYRINDNKFYTDPATVSLSNPTGIETKASDHVRFLDANAILALGAEYQLGKSTKVLAGFSYHRGLINLDTYFEKDRGFKDITIKNNVFALDLGMKF